MVPESIQTAFHGCTIRKICMNTTKSTESACPWCPAVYTCSVCTRDFVESGSLFRDWHIQAICLYSWINICMKLSTSAKETFERWLILLVNILLGQTQVFGWQERLQVRRVSVQDDERSRQPVTSKTTEYVGEKKFMNSSMRMNNPSALPHDLESTRRS